MRVLNGRPRANAFRLVPADARGHFLIHVFAAVYRLVDYARRLADAAVEEREESAGVEDLFAAFPFLAGYFAEMRDFMPDDITWEDGAAWWADEVAAWEASAGDGTRLPLSALGREAGLDWSGRMAFILAGLVEEDSRFGTLFAQIQAPLPHRRPCLELVGQIAGAGIDGAPDAWSVCRPLLEAGLVEVANPDAPRSEWLPRVPGMLWDAIRGEAGARPATGCRYHSPDAHPPIADLILPDDLRERLAEVPLLIRAGKASAVVLRGMQGSERLTVMGALARALGLGVVEVDLTDRSGEHPPEALGAFCTAISALPVLTYDLGPGETAEPPALAGYRGPLGVLLGLEGGLRGEAAERAITLMLPAPRAPHRRRHWSDALGRHPADDLDQISERFHLPGGHIKQAAAIAVAHAALARRGTVTLADVREACRSLNRQLLDTLATRVEGGGSWDHLVVGFATGEKLRELERRCRHRERLLDHLGPAFGGTNRGVRALFSGPSGTGKTLAARILAAELGMDLYRVDLSAVVNKYIGETEKNLHRVLSRAEELDVVLLLDEGDALLGNRTEVKSANDRYANLETNFLLQRLEHYQGIVIVTTNAGQFIDTAFQRRMDAVVGFLPPGEDERWQIWQLHLPGDHALEPEDLQEIAARCALTGGQIRNAALHATLLALDEGGGPVRRWHVEAALESEYRKAGALCPLTEDGWGRSVPADMDAFLGALAR